MTRSQLFRRLLAAGVLAALTTVVPVTAQNVSDGELLLREALHKQQVEGDLPGAIKIYQQIVTASNRNRAIVARALLEMAGCYEKLGQQAEAVYQQIVREFGDQPAAVQARARLAALRPAVSEPTMTLRKVQVGDGIQNVVTGDGQRVVYWDSTRTTLFLGDISGKERNVILKTDKAPRVSVSRDLSMAFLTFPPTMQGPIKFAVVKTDGAGYRELTLTQNGTPLRVGGLGPVCASWSWDKQYVVLCNGEGNTGRLLKVSVANGEVRDLLPGRTTSASRAEFSPDGRYVAHDLGYPVGVGVVSAEGGESRTVSPDVYFADWSRDGRYLLVADVSANSMTLTAVGVSDGQPTGERISLRAVPGGQARTLLNGRLLVGSGSGRPRMVSLGTLDGHDKSVQWTELGLIGNPVPYTNYSWSRDGQKFAYVSREPNGTTLVVRLRDLSTGDDRELYRGARLGSCLLGRVTPQIFCTQAGGPNSTEIISVAIETRLVERVGLLEGRVVLDHVRNDDKALMIVNGQKSTFSEWEVGTDRQRDLRDFQSEDGRWAFGVVTEPENRGFMKVRPAGGDTEWRLLAPRRAAPPTMGEPIPIRFSPDGNWIVYHDQDPDGADGLYRVATAGGAPERLGDYPTSSLTSVLSVSPDGRKFLVNAPPPPARPELWVLENFLPAAPASAKAGQPKRNN